MLKFIKNFRKDEDGAVTVDWVVLTAAVVAMALGAYSMIGDSANALLSATGDAVGDHETSLFGG
ncbi:hypothetical protein AYJ57_15600 [Salipiger sp. CCB-MM3]|uniref:Flp family type IVb pilin n=1 Tax=Roseobacteraceae TaxID=2854170 RepID=UPI00080AA3FF|nr:MULTISPECIES: hypothetical protein [Roseobacteraceae]ANT61884.1 hypothetical protein AYJ57_15600 [Salipiger sp. CCB-MM3]MCA0997686.1 hypothetical protein [Alloyangia pacifica]